MENLSEKRAQNLLRKYLQGQCTGPEKAIVEEWYLSLQSEEEVIDEAVFLENLVELNKRLHEITVSQKVRRLKYISVAAAVLLFFLGVNLLWKKEDFSEHEKTITVPAGNIPPGSNKAILSVDGIENMELSGSQEALVSNDSSLEYEDGTLVKNLDKAQFITLTTPAAGQYRAVLPDGTKVWLNALSSIKYPAVFDKKRRIVEVTGEVYFEVKNNPDKTFIVHANHQEIEVLGTSFNIHEYEDESQGYTSLIEGSLKVTNENAKNVILTPGQQAVVSKENVIEVKNVDVEEVSAWKDGLYILQDARLDKFVKNIERWYDVQIDMGEHGNKRLSAIIPRDAKLSDVLKTIALKTKIQFKMKGRRLKVIN